MEGFVPVLDLAPEALFSILHEAGCLRLPIPLEQDIRDTLDIPDGPSALIDTWGVWKEDQIELERDLSITNRVCYKIVRFPLEVGEDGPAEVWVETVWDGDSVSGWIPYGTLLGDGEATFKKAFEQLQKQSEDSTAILARVSREVSIIKIGMIEMHSDIRSIQGKIDAQAVQWKTAATSESKTVKEVKLHMQTQLLEQNTLFQKQLSSVNNSLGQQHQTIKAMEVMVEGVTKLQPTQELMQIVVKLDSRLDGHISKTTQQIQLMQDTAQTVKPQADISQALEALEGRMKTYAEVVTVTQTAALKAQDDEKAARQARSLNLRISGLEEQDGENTRERVMDFFKEDLKVVSPEISQAFRIGKGERGVRPILVKFTCLEQRSLVLGNRSLLKGRRIWLESDLTPAQAIEKKKELDKVRKANEDGWIAYLHEGRAVITTRRREKKDSSE
ncbi:hypothetical protein R1sor_010479 [Riccia sorocarpa]|uniref:Uncharacterized protein n=1 Tax=Riccia sorocarpa TaxID=122646 RepID=A0ABD3HY83_9MARC